jgi:hypothetical protein
MIKALVYQFEEYDRRIFWILSAFFFAALLCYLYFLSVSVYAVVSRKSAEQEMMSVSSRITELETSYAELDKHIDLALAHERGFVDVGVPEYVSLRAHTETALSLRPSGR